MDPATLSLLIKLASDLTVRIVAIWRAAGQEKTAAEIEAILTRTLTILDQTEDLIDGELQPTPIPTPTPTPDPDWARDASAVDPSDARLAVVQAVRARYGETLSLEQGVLVANETAFRLNDDTISGPWGLQRSVPGDTRSHLGFSPYHVCDYTTGTVYVVLDSVPGVGTARWAVATRLTPAWMAAKASWIPTGPAPVPVPPETDTTLRASVTALEQRVAALERKVGGS